MRLHLLTVSARQPDWVERGTAEYLGRLPREFACALVEIKPVARAAPSSDALAREGERVLAKLPRAAHVVLFDERGSSVDTAAFAQRLARWQEQHADVALLIGGADGHAPAVRAVAAESLSLSALTLPHGLARVVIAEQLYRAVSLLRGHPYHRV